MNLKKIIITAFAVSVPVALLLNHGADVLPGMQEGVPRRIVSLSPSITRCIIDLGAEDLLAGVTDYSLHPELKAESVGTYMSPNLEKIIRLKPDLVLISEEDRYIQKTPLLEKFGVRVEKLGRNMDFESMSVNYMHLGEILGRRDLAAQKIADYRMRLVQIEKQKIPVRIVFLVSVNPIVTVSGGSHISAIIRDAGGLNVYESASTPYPILSLESLLLSGADALIVMEMGYRSHIKSLLSGYSNVDFAGKGNIFVAGDENIPYYTPGDYVISVEKIAAFIKMIKR